MIKRIAMLSAVLVFGFSVVACSTWKGAGKDVEDAGQSMQNSAE